jgi:hypothetical protein
MNVVPLCTGQADCGCWVVSRQVRRIPTRRLEPDERANIAPRPRLLPVDLCSFRKMVIKSREMLPDPIIPEKGWSWSTAIAVRASPMWVSYRVCYFDRWEVPKMGGAQTAQGSLDRRRDACGGSSREVKRDC